MVDKIKVLIADDHPVFREGLKRLLDTRQDLQCVACASDGEEALRLASELEIDVAILDVAMPGLDGLEAAKQIKLNKPNTSVIILSAYDYAPYISLALSAGASGYLLKDSDFRDIVSAIHFVHSGKAVFDMKTVRNITSYFPDHKTEPVTEPCRLSKRELEILTLVANGLSNKSIAQHLGIGRRTVDGYITRMFGKLDVKSRTQAVLHALIAGWLTLEEIKRDVSNKNQP